MRLVKCRCHACQITRTYDADLDAARRKTCPRCGRRLVVHHVSAPELDPAKLPAVLKPPGIEHYVLTERANSIARALIESALGTERSNA